MPTRRNPRAGLAPEQLDPDAHNVGSVCSTFTGEQLAGTAKPGHIVLALEYPRGWGHDILDGEALGNELAGKIKAFLKAHNAQLQFIRKPGREGQHHAENTRSVLFINWSQGVTSSTHPIAERMLVDGPESILELDLSQPGNTPGAERVDHPLLLICTHGKRDRCCAVRGRPLATALSAQYGDEQVWESSHTKGHRFAPSMLLLPSNYSYGRITISSASEMLEAARQGELWLQGNRGRGIYDAPGQVAEITVARRLQREAGEPVKESALVVHSTTLSELQEHYTVKTGPARSSHSGVGQSPTELSAIGSATQTTADLCYRLVKDTVSGRVWGVQLQRRTSVPIVASCGDAPKPSKSWVSTTVIELALKSELTLRSKSESQG
ncbi:sucrase ferredoxin [Corynebacterium sp. 4HC-13]|uniref:Sucrase ferredoxin n=2 Tax=Corynebacterium anserum TaxID=2684406 RepID=A0A7G7YR99_9CORY|nr:sucrase ferredoxin [Corynebacterium anserum]MBC2682174.1 sucrase ferredoxin [Corynebacterium anserum]QNH97019.1 sucrase ferredoxin [Corynebacterium anserum]